MSEAKYGLQDSNVESQIRRVNHIYDLRLSRDYKGLEKKLLDDTRSFSNDSYAKPRISFELAGLYSFQLFDIEKAIKLDESILANAIIDEDLKRAFLPRSSAANQVILSDQKYVNEFVGIKKHEILKKVKKRLSINKLLVRGVKVKSKKYTVRRLRQHIQTVKGDIDSGFSSAMDQKMLISRLINGEYELKKVSPRFKFNAYKYFISGDISLHEVDLSEINFINLADYFSQVFKQTNRIRFATYALNLIYRPYTNLRKPENRWKYNTLINKYISTLIDANYLQHNYEDMIYYISLNKSRMLIEERLLLSENNAKGKNIVSQLGGTEQDINGLPSKRAFKQKLSSVDAFLDFYVDGYYSKKRSAIKSSARSITPMGTRDFGIEPNEGVEEVFVDSDVFITYISAGEVVSVEKISGRRLKAFKRELNTSLNSISRRTHGEQQSKLLHALSRKLKLPRKLTISPDKWISQHPINFHLSAQSVRSVNLFTESKGELLKRIDIVGFFNPTLDLEGAEKEADAILLSTPSAKVFKREAAKLNELMTASDANIVHLSMHGGFNSKEPKYSKLYFAGAKKGFGKSDANALYAKDMANYALLKGRQLVFAAACETGKVVADQANENELMGILRPLTANRNKNIILSLWKVDDLATKDFVTWFYKGLDKTHVVKAAFLLAQEKVREKYKAPYYWAAFYLSQAN